MSAWDNRSAIVNAFLGVLSRVGAIEAHGDGGGVVYMGVDSVGTTKGTSWDTGATLPERLRNTAAITRLNIVSLLARTQTPLI